MRHLASAMAAFAVLFGPVALAGSYQNAARLTAAVGLEAELDRAIAETRTALRAQLLAAGQPAQAVERLIEAIETEMIAGKPVLIADVTRIYAEKFTDAEIDDIVEFYETPTGRKMVASQADLVAAYARAIEVWVTLSIERAQAKVDAGGASV